MSSDDPPVQLPLAIPVGSRANKSDHRRVLDGLDAFGYSCVAATAEVSLEQSGGMYSRPRAFLCADGQVYWVKHRAQTGLSSELIANRLAHKLGVGPPTAVVTFDPFLVGGEAASLGVGTANVRDVVSSKDVRAGTLSVDVDPESRAAVAVFQSWADVMDQQVLIGTKTGRVYSIDHGEAFRIISAGPPRFMLAEIPGARFNWASGTRAALEMVEKIEDLTELEILQAVSAMPDGPGWHAQPERRLTIGRWLMKRQQLIGREVSKWVQSVA